MRDDILAACRRHLGEVGAGLELRFEGLRLPERVTVSFDFDAGDLTRQLERIGALTLGSTLALTLAGIAAVGPLAGVVIVAGLVARHTLSSSLRGDVKRRLKTSLAPALDLLLTELFRNVRDDITRTAAQFRLEVEEFLHGATADIDQTLSRMEQRWPDEEDGETRRQHLQDRLAELEDLQRELESLTEPEW